MIVPAGTYIITQSLEIKHSNIVLRGAGVRLLRHWAAACLPACHCQAEGCGHCRPTSNPHVMHPCIHSCPAMAPRHTAHCLACRKGRQRCTFQRDCRRCMAQATPGPLAVPSSCEHSARPASSHFKLGPACLRCLLAFSGQQKPSHTLHFTSLACAAPTLSPMLCSIDGYNAGSNQEDFARTKITADARKGDRRLKVGRGSGDQQLAAAPACALAQPLANLLPHSCAVRHLRQPAALLDSCATHAGWQHQGH